MKIMSEVIVGGLDFLTVPAFSFLITHPPTGRKLIFDLGVRKSWETRGPTPLVERLKNNGFEIKVDKDVADILPEHGIRPEEIEAIIWSHYHFDHTGDPSRFPPSTALYTGPGVIERFPTAWPTNKNAPLNEDAWTGRERKEISFDESSPRIGRFQAHDFFGDGSFYVLNSPGHLLGHVCGLARTTADSFIFMGGDAAHHAGEFRPTEYVPLPDEIAFPAPPKGFPVPCPGHLLLDHVHPEHRADKPFYLDSHGMNEDPERAQWSVEGIMELDADERVFSVIAHDASLLPVLDFFPKRANEWKARGWGEKGRWRFLGDFVEALKDVKDGGKL